MIRITFILILILIISLDCFSDPVSIAEDYLNLQWVVDSVNVYSHYTATGNPHEGYTSTYPCDWIDSIGVTITGIPYHFGGKDSFTQWNNDYVNGNYGPGAHSAHYSPNPPSSLWWAAGIDCAGLVGRCWEIPEASMDSCNCSYLIVHSNQITGQQVQPGDAFISGHARLCYYRIESDTLNDRVQTIEATSDIYNKVIEHEYSIAQMITEGYSCQSLNEVTNVPGGNVSGTWTLDNCPYMISGEITIPLGSQLTIEPGVNVIFTGHYKFNIYGRLSAVGEEHGYIFFTAQDTTTGWNGLRFYDQNTNGQDSSKVVYCKLQYGRATGGYPVFFGGAVYCDDSSPIFEDCLFINNSADGGGGAMGLYNWSSPDIRRTRFTNNSAMDGGAIYIWNPEYSSSFPLFEELIFENNTASNTGGAINCYKSVYPVLINCTFNQNTALNRTGGGALYCYDNCNVNFFNTIMWQDSSPELYIDNNCSVEIYDCDLTNGENSYILGMYSWITFDGNILSSNPRFVDSNTSNFNLEWTSPCIDMGSTVTVRTENRSYQRNRDDDGTLPDIGARSYYQQSEIDTPTDLVISTEQDSIYLDWTHGDGAIFYKICESLNPHSNFTIIDSVFGKTDYSKSIDNNTNFYKIIGGNNRVE